MNLSITWKGFGLKSTRFDRPTHRLNLVFGGVLCNRYIMMICTHVASVSVCSYDFNRQPCPPSTSGRNCTVHHVLPTLTTCSVRQGRTFVLCKSLNGKNTTSASSSASNSQGRFNLGKARDALERQLLVPERPRNLWMAAIKPPMYTVAYVPILVGGAAAYYVTGVLQGILLLQLCLASTLIIAWLNTSNDGFDAFTGVDSDGRKPESIVSLTGASPVLVLLAAHAMLAAGAYMLFTILTPAGDARVLPLLGAAVACGYLYQGPPFRLSYWGLGEPLCFLAFGPLATTAFFLAQVYVTHGAHVPWGQSMLRLWIAPMASSPVLVVPPMVWAAGAMVGTTTAAILFCSHFHQIEGDRAAGKQSPLVRLGHQTATEALRLTCIGLYCCAAWLVYIGMFPAEALWLLASTLPSCLDMLTYAHMHHYEPSLIRVLKFRAIKWHTAVGLALASAFTLARIGGLAGLRVATGL